MYRLLPIIFALISQAAYSQTNPIFQRVMKTGNAGVYDTKEWSFNSGSPIRSTPLIIGETIYFGNAAGQFFCINKKTSKTNWSFQAGSAIHSSAIHASGLIFFADNTQTIYAVTAKEGKLKWKFNCGSKVPYPWRFDYFYSSPIVIGNSIVIGSDDGHVYMLTLQTGKLTWKFKANYPIRATVANKADKLFFGDMGGRFYAINAANGQLKWTFSTMGDTLRSENFGYDRKAILSSAILQSDKIIFGARDGFLYCIDTTGKFIWSSDHKISWVISTVAVAENIVVTGTSDGRFVQGVDLETGQEKWRFRSSTLFWSSPLIIDSRVYIGGFDGNLYCLDLQTGKRISQFSTGANIFSSAVYDKEHVYMGSDDGHLYSLTSHLDSRVDRIDSLKRFVFYEPGVNIYFKDGSDLKIRNYMQSMGFLAIKSDTLQTILKTHATNSVIVFASDYLPSSVLSGGKSSLIGNYLDAGGRIVLTGLNPSTYKIEEKEKYPLGFNILQADTVFGLKYGANDTRSFQGVFTSFPNQYGKQFGLHGYSVSTLFIDPVQVDRVLSSNENGAASAFIKYYNNNGRLVQVFLDPKVPANIDAVVKLSEWKIE